ncbi:T9SS type A sorting domain-containing protein [Flaviaesturariibacter flavus]|nr:T9SS type A sorting domain-containing protein [Flaviaesturariibacter flavus]
MRKIFTLALLCAMLSPDADAQRAGSRRISTTSPARVLTCPATTVASTTPASRCGVGTVNLQATAPAGSGIVWYDAATGGNQLATGNSLTTPVIGSTTTFYAEPQTVSTPFAVGLASDNAANLTAYSDYGMFFATTDAAIIQSVDVYPAIAGDLTIYLYDDNDNEIASQTVNILQSEVSTTTKKTITLNFQVPANKSGWYLYYDNDLYRGAGTYTYPAAVNGFSITGNTLDGDNLTSGSRYYFYNWQVKTVCAGARAAVVATVTPPPAITVSAGQNSICAGASTTLSVASANSNYTYSWSPGGLTGASQTVTPSASTRYVLTATDNGTGCVAKDSVSVAVNRNPSPVVISPATAAACSGAPASLAGTGGQINGLVLLREDFNSGAPAWTRTNLSTGGTPTAADWTAHNSGYVYSFVTFASNDNSTFMMSNSDAQGSGSTTIAQLRSPAFSTMGMSTLSLEFYHYFRYYSFAPTDSATVEVSVDGTTWTSVQSYKAATVGAADQFETASVSLDAWVNQPTLYIRFKYTSNYGYYWAIDNVTVQGDQRTNMTWAPTTGLFTDAAASVPYTGGPAANVYANPASATTYTVTATSPGGCTSTGTVAVTLAPGTSIVTQPVAAQTVCAGSPVTFSVTGSGSNLTYRWRRNGLVLPGGFNPTYTIASATTADAATYTVDVMGACGSVTSANAVLTVNSATAIGTQPAATVSVCNGSPATFSVGATGSGTLTYQWKKGGTNISGANAATYTIAAATAADAATYTVDVTGTCGTVTSSGSVLSIAPVTAITTQPAATLAVCAGAPATFSVTASGGSLTYQWRKNGVNISGATSATYTIPAAAAADAANYTVVVTGGCGSSITSTATALSLNANTAITTQPTAVTTCANTSATFNVGASGTGLGYQWRKGGNNISGANAASYTIASVTAADAANYDVVVSGSCGSATSNPVALAVNTCTAVSSIDPNIGGAALFPNRVLASAMLRVQAARSSRIQWQVLDASGRRVLTFTQNVHAGTNELQLRFAALQSGTYLLSGSTEKGKTEVLRFVKL